jgi:hypothetical protein
MFQEAKGRSDAAIKQTAAKAVPGTSECHPDALGGATAAALRSAERVRRFQLRTASSSGQAEKQPTARVASGAHRPTTLGERLLQRLLGESLSEQFLNAVPLLTRILYQFNHLGILFYQIYHYSPLAFCLFCALHPLVKISLRANRLAAVALFMLFLRSKSCLVSKENS